MSLNPCCRGIWSRSSSAPKLGVPRWVLILVVVEYGLEVESGTHRDRKGLS